MCVTLWHAIEQKVNRVHLLETMDVYTQFSFGIGQNLAWLKTTAVTKYSG